MKSDINNNNNKKPFTRNSTERLSFVKDKSVNEKVIQLKWNLSWISTYIDTNVCFFFKYYF